MKFSARLSASAEPVLLFCVQFGHGAIQVRQQEDRVVAESAGPGGSARDDPGNFSLSRPNDLSGPCRGQGAVKHSMPLAIRHRLHFPKYAFYT